MGTSSRSCLGAIGRTPLCSPDSKRLLHNGLTHYYLLIFEFEKSLILEEIRGCPFAFLSLCSLCRLINFNQV